jgi:hypothetical protein
MDTRTSSIDQKIAKLDGELKKLRDAMARMPEGPSKVRQGTIARVRVCWLTRGRAGRPGPERLQAAGADAPQAKENVRGAWCAR